jgi:hypothetical protein
MTLDLCFFQLLQLAVQSPQGQDGRLWGPLRARVKGKRLWMWGWNPLLPAGVRIVYAVMFLCADTDEVMRM